MEFDLHIGIDYSGAQTPTSRLSTLQVYAAADGLPEPVRSPASTPDKHRKWTRQEIASWVVEAVSSDKRCIIGIDHAFSFPLGYFERYQLKSWPEFLADFCTHWPTDREGVSVDSIREQAQSIRTGNPTDLRLTEQWTSSAKSVFRFDVQGSVAKSTHAGIP